MRPIRAFALLAVFVAIAVTLPAHAQPDRMAWWREARFGMFIHWGLYAVPGGEWGSPPKTDHGEWIRTTAQIPIDEYDRLRERFNPVKFDADAIVLAAKNAGMGYIVITTKHHDGFCLFDSAATDFDVMSTPFKRDIMREMADACRRHGVKIGWYYSIMDWHHPDYLPRRDWEKDRTAAEANFNHYVAYMKAQLKELLTNYGDIGVLWFDGQWEGNWNDERGKDLEAYVRSIAPNVIINSRVGRAGGNYGLDAESGMLGDYATPEQFIPDASPGFDWETCMTMNDHWGYNRADENFKSTTTLVRMLVDVASKGGNLLLNIGPTEKGEIPPESVRRLRGIGAWMTDNGDSVRGVDMSIAVGRQVRGSPFPPGHLPWGRCTSRIMPEVVRDTRLYLHIFDWPKDGRLVIPGISNTTTGEQACRMLAGQDSRLLIVQRDENALIVLLPPQPANDIDSVVQIDISGEPDIAVPPVISAAADIFIDSLPVTLASERDNVEVRYTLDGTDPVPTSPLVMAPVVIDRAREVRAACFRDGRRVSPVATREFNLVPPRPAYVPAASERGLKCHIHTWETGDIQSVEELISMQSIAEQVVPDFSLNAVQPREKHWGVRYRGLLRVPRTGVYEFSVGSDDGSRLWIGGDLVVDNDKPHSFKAELGVYALTEGLHPIFVQFFENWGGCALSVQWRQIGHPMRALEPADLAHEP